MKIKHVQIKDFRGIDELSLDFGSDNINVLIGVNGVGKSSIIDCLGLLLSLYVKRLRTVFGERKLQKSSKNEVDDIRNGASSSILKILIDHNHKDFTWSKSIMRENTFAGFETIDDIPLVNLVNEIVPSYFDQSYSPDSSIPLVICYQGKRISNALDN